MQAAEHLASAADALACLAPHMESPTNPVISAANVDAVKIANRANVFFIASSHEFPGLARRSNYKCLQTTPTNYITISPAWRHATAVRGHNRRGPWAKRCG